MTSKVGRSTLKMNSSPAIISYGAVAGKKESEGPLKDHFDKTYSDDYLGQDNWEKAECQLQKDVVSITLEKANLKADDIDIVFAGDLLNQNISSHFSLRDLNIPFIGMYGACSNMAETMNMASIFVDNEAAENALALTSSHFCTAERQYRFPLEYGGQRTPNSQWTATAAGSIIVGPANRAGPYVKQICIGKIVDMGVNDINNMGAAMAPAAADTIRTFLQETQTKPEDYDLIVTGDLGKVGSRLLIELLQQDDITIEQQYNDCGLLLYDLKRQEVDAGGSGCGCSASVLCSYILPKIKNGSLKDVLFIATGALMSTTSFQQKETIPCIAHLTHLSNTQWEEEE